MDKIAESFVIILTGIFHKRIEYPDKVPAKPILDGARLKGQPMPPEDAKIVDDENYNDSQWLIVEEERRQTPRNGAKQGSSHHGKAHVRAPRPVRAQPEAEAQAAENTKAKKGRKVQATARLKVAHKAKAAGKAKVAVPAKTTKAVSSRPRRKSEDNPPGEALPTGTDE